MGLTWHISHHNTIDCWYCLCCMGWSIFKSQHVVLHEKIYRYFINEFVWIWLNIVFFCMVHTHGEYYPLIPTNILKEDRRHLESHYNKWWHWHPEVESCVITSVDKYVVMTGLAAMHIYHSSCWEGWLSWGEVFLCPLFVCLWNRLLWWTCTKVWW